LPGLPPQIGDFVEVRGRPWLVEGIDDKGEGLSALKLSCISDDAQGEALEVAWDAEIGARRLEDDFWSRLGRVLRGDLDARGASIWMRKGRRMRDGGRA
jgi:hypothetical protein